LKLRAARLLAKKTIDDRARLFDRVGDLYKTRRTIVHTGSQEVSDEISPPLVG